MRFERLGRQAVFRVLRALLLLVSLPFVMAVSCQETIRLDFTFTGTDWSARLRPDLGPLDAVQQRQVLSRFSDGGADGTSLVSLLYPETPQVAAGRMPWAPVIWMPRGTPLRLSYEVFFYNPRFNGTIPGETVGAYSDVVGNAPRRVKQATSNTRGIVMPGNRNFLVYLGGGDPLVLDASQFNAGFYGFPNVLGVALETCTAGTARSDPADPPVGLDQGCSRRLVDRTVCTDGAYGASLFPGTVIRCRLSADTDSSFQLLMTDVGDPNRPGSDVVPGTSQPPLTVLPPL